VQESFIEHLLSVINKHQIKAQDLILELTENVFIEDLLLVTDKCKQLSQLGVKLSLDDFGTGYSSLGLLNKLPFSELKIDKSFVDEISSDMQSRLMLKNILSIADNYQIPVVAEGVEDDQQRGILTKLGCGQFQGYLFAKPMKSSDVIEFIHEQIESRA
jgi:EAL domain-containing protein (putative c-di-GMP-specific phosphodiesterase class I)